MENRKEYSNAAEIEVSKIPQSVINQLASLLYEVFQDSTYETESQKLNINSNLQYNSRCDSAV